MSLESVTIGLQRIEAICRQLPRLGIEVADEAEKLYRLASGTKFVCGRTVHMCAGAAVYLAIRRAACISYFLVDVAEQVQCGPFDLAHVACDMAARLQLNLPIIDATAYVDRMVEDLELGPQSARVRATTVALIKRFNGDWMATGRRPAGICAAALALATQTHSIDVPMERLIEVAKVGASTIDLRLREVGNTALSALPVWKLRDHPELAEQAVAAKLPPALQRRHELTSPLETPTGTPTEDAREDLRRSMDTIAEEIRAARRRAPTGELDTFSDEELADVDCMVLSEEDATRKGAVFLAMHRTYLENRTGRCAISGADAGAFTTPLGDEISGNEDWEFGDCEM